MNWLRPSIAWKLYLVSGLALLLTGCLQSISGGVLSASLADMPVWGYSSFLACFNFPLGTLMLLTAWLLHGDDDEDE